MSKGVHFKAGVSALIWALFILSVNPDYILYLTNDPREPYNVQSRAETDPADTLIADLRTISETSVITGADRWHVSA